MTENPLQPAPGPATLDDAQAQTSGQIYEKPDTHKTLIIILTLITTITTAIVAGLQADANIRANNANRDSQYYAILASGEIHRQGLQSNYDLSTMTEYLRLSQEATLMELTALSLKESNDTAAQAATELTSLGAQARADKLMTYSVFYMDPRYAPQSADGIPNMDAYAADALAKANEITEVQNHASDEFRRWDGKADAYVSVLTIMAMAFFLFGLAQALKDRMRLVFAIFGATILLASTIWTVVILFI